MHRFQPSVWLLPLLIQASYHSLFFSLRLKYSFLEGSKVISGKAGYHIRKIFLRLLRLLLRSPFIVFGAMILALTIDTKAALIFAVLMVYYGALAAKQFWNYTWVNIPKMKRGPTWLCLPVCGATSALYLIGQIVEEIGDLMKGGNE